MCCLFRSRPRRNSGMAEHDVVSAGTRPGPGKYDIVKGQIKYMDFDLPNSSERRAQVPLLSASSTNLGSTNPSGILL